MDGTSSIIDALHSKSPYVVKSIWEVCGQPTGLHGLQVGGRPENGAALSEVNVLRDNDPQSSRLPTHFATIVKLLILTGQRRGEIAALRAEYCDLRGGASTPNGLVPKDVSAPSQCTITLPPSLTKNGREHTFPIGAFSADILTKALSTLPPANGYIFSARMPSIGPFNGWSKSKAQLDQLSGHETQTSGNEDPQRDSRICEDIAT